VLAIEDQEEFAILMRLVLRAWGHDGCLLPRDQALLAVWSGSSEATVGWVVEAHFIEEGIGLAYPPLLERFKKLEEAHLSRVNRGRKGGKSSGKTRRSKSTKQCFDNDAKQCFDEARSSTSSAKQCFDSASDVKSTTCDEEKNPASRARVRSINNIPRVSDQNHLRGTGGAAREGDQEETVVLPDSAPPKKKRARKLDPIWEALVEALGFAPETTSERGRWNKAIKELRQIGATPEQIGARSREYLSRFQGRASLTPTALTSNWSLLASAPKPAPSRIKYSNDLPAGWTEQSWAEFSERQDRAAAKRKEDREAYVKGRPFGNLRPPV